LRSFNRLQVSSQTKTGDEIQTQLEHSRQLCQNSRSSAASNFILEAIEKAPAPASLPGQRLQGGNKARQKIRRPLQPLMCAASGALSAKAKALRRIGNPIVERDPSQLAEGKVHFHRVELWRSGSEISSAQLGRIEIRLPAAYAQPEVPAYSSP